MRESRSRWANQYPRSSRDALSRIHSPLKHTISTLRIKIFNPPISGHPNNLPSPRKKEKFSPTTNCQDLQTYSSLITQYNSHTYVKKNSHKVVIGESTY
jgi:hypothetical protein